MNAAPTCPLGSKWIYGSISVTVEFIRSHAIQHSNISLNDQQNNNKIPNKNCSNAHCINCWRLCRFHLTTTNQFKRLPRRVVKCERIVGNYCTYSAFWREYFVRTLKLNTFKTVFCVSTGYKGDTKIQSANITATTTTTRLTTKAASPEATEAINAVESQKNFQQFAGIRVWTQLFFVSGYHWITFVLLAQAVFDFICVLFRVCWPLFMCLFSLFIVRIIACAAIEQNGTRTWEIAIFDRKSEKTKYQSKNHIAIFVVVSIYWLLVCRCVRVCVFAGFFSTRRRGIYRNYWCLLWMKLWQKYLTFGVFICEV